MIIYFSLTSEIINCNYVKRTGSFPESFTLFGWTGTTRLGCQKISPLMNRTKLVSLRVVKYYKSKMSVIYARSQKDKKCALQLVPIRQWRVTMKVFLD